MTMPLTASLNDGRQRRARGAAAWLGLAASPTFALMASLAASGSPRLSICSSASGMLPIDGMTWMYLLLGVFHLSPWLKLALR